LCRLPRLPLTMTSRLSILPALALVATIWACTGSNGGHAGMPSPPPTAARNAGPTAPSVAPAQIRDVRQAIFLSPSRNIGCDLSASAVRCDIGRRAWAAPAKPADCDLDWGNGVRLELGHPAVFLCAGDSLLGATKDILRYGHALRAGDFRCDSESAAMRCRNERTGHGFMLSAEDYKLY
jgi:hypothetical protein